MNVSRLIKKGKEAKEKTIMKSFRLRNSANEALKLLSKFSGISGNEIVNSAIEGLGAEMRLLEKIDNELKIDGATITTGYQTSSGYTTIFEISKILDSFNRDVLYNVKYSVSHINKPDDTQEHEFILQNINDLLDLGFNGNYQIFRQQPKLKESE